MTYAIWAASVIACIFGWLVVWQEVTAPAKWSYRITLVSLWACTTWIIGSWPLR